MCTLREMLDRLTTPPYPSYSTGLFTDVWNPKKSPVRQRTLAPSLFGLSYGTRGPYLGLTPVTPTLTLTGQTLTFAAGHWVNDTATPRTTPTATSRDSCRERPEADPRVRRLTKKVRNLEEENNALKLHVELLLDMLTETTAEVYVLTYTLKDVDEALAKSRKKNSQEISQ
ncbi:protein chibby homolog 1 [Alosa alosa]|uniref:protein chibby homolog 1-like n=1 Tax=Alosa sapidissima TaxID=34773 RepID=UPI001C083E83|nr:protein chibby homolog 1-like [Alosa sapidissima]XP_041931381.1 protein chibby homolog 1-like [Alosa sapidissima]XP_048087879.1 protein chibby homolog 1 [Alosa alosa]XP_048087880.1 protein chibby homolog 1 [Alosa alosa]